MMREVRGRDRHDLTAGSVHEQRRGFLPGGFARRPPSRAVARRHHRMRTLARMRTAVHLVSAEQVFFAAARACSATTASVARGRPGRGRASLARRLVDARRPRRRALARKNARGGGVRPRPR